MARASGTDFVRAAARYIGTPYVWGGESPAGFDCSGLVEYTLTKIGVRGVPRTSEEQWGWVKKVNYNRLQAGDLVFLNFPGEVSPGHVMIYAGGNRVIQAPTTGQLVKVSSFTPPPAGSSVWGATIVGYGRPPGLSFRGERYDPVLPVTAFSTTGVGGSSGLYQAPPRPGSAPPGGEGDYAGLWNYIPLYPGGPSAGAAGDALDSASKHIPIVGGIVNALDSAGSVADAIAQGFKFFIWLLSKKHWAMMAEVVVGVVLIGIGIFWLGSDARSSDVSVRPKDLAATGKRALLGRPGSRSEARSEVREGAAKSVGGAPGKVASGASKTATAAKSASRAGTSGASKATTRAVSTARIVTRKIK